ncbi:GW dipeptide domain-containing protein [Vagococcus fluvialis]|uniref:GW dipeptide domain-containing protein n=1 Tax=Vagococcus fluvialis TaxID=2738 RepID=UPI001A8C79F0|nr:GW dipeptide domain-containing protein [Vagococcus fluvialis]MBO0487273.1 SH3-like domain-containing protein [Vagococcus fluvialis]
MKKKISIYASLTVLLSPSIVMAEEVMTSTSSTQNIVEEVVGQTEDTDVTVSSEKKEVSSETSEILKIEETEKIEEVKKEKQPDLVFFNGEWIEIEPEPEEIAGMEKYEQPEIDESNQNALGSFNVRVESRAFFSEPRAIESTNQNIPRIDFVDVSSHQGNISVADYKVMKQQGVTGVVVKLTESTNYINPDAANQINNAKVAGLKVSAYHFSHFINKDSAIAEARFFAKTAKDLGLDSSTVMVNDAEKSTMNNGRITENSIYFASTLKNEFGFNRVIHYSMASWFTPKILDMNRLGGELSSWKAEFPYSPSKNNLLHKGAAAWQWGSSTHFVGDSQKSRIFDTNIDYSNTFSSPLKYDISPIIKKSFIANNQGAIYNEPYVSGTVRQDTTEGMLNQMIDITAQSETGYGLWYQFSYVKSGVKKVGWIKSTDIQDIIEEKETNQLLYVNIENGAVYDTPYTETTKKIGTTAGFKNKEFKVSKSAKTGYGVWCFGEYEQNNVKKFGWIKSTDLVNELVVITPINDKTFIINGYAAIYEKPYVDGVQRQDITTGMNGQVIDLTAKSTTTFGEWYEFSYVKSGVKKTGWIKSTDTKSIIDEKKEDKMLFISNENGAVYDSPYTASTKKIGTTAGFKNKEFKVSKSALTGYGLWYFGNYTQDKEKKSSWVNKTDLTDNIVVITPINDKTFIVNDYGAIYEKPYVEGVKRQDVTTGMKGQVIDLTAKSTTTFGEWYEFSYVKSGVKKTGWIKSTDTQSIIEERKENQTFSIINENGAVYDSPYTAGTKKIGTTAGFKNKEFKVLKSAKTGYGLWYYGEYTQNNAKKSGWIKSVDIKNNLNVITPITDKTFIVNDYGAIYEKPYVEGVKRQDVTTGMSGQVIDLTAKSTTSFGEWYKFSYVKSGVKKIGWIKSTDTQSIIKEKNENSLFTIINENGAVYDSPYTADTKKIGTTSGFKNKEFKTSKSAKTGYGLWYYGEYTQNNTKKVGWIKSVDMSNNLNVITPITDKTFIMNNSGAIYEKPYVEGVKRQDVTTGMSGQVIDLTAKSTTSFGEWYEFSYIKSGVKKVGWIKSTDTQSIIEEKNENQVFSIVNEKGAVYDSPYTASTQKIGTTEGFKNKEFKVSKSAKTGYGLWYYGEYTQNNTKKVGWIKSIDLK